MCSRDYLFLFRLGAIDYRPYLRYEGTLMVFGYLNVKHMHNVMGRARKKEKTITAKKKQVHIQAVI